jgi:hypothetical protein
MMTEISLATVKGFKSKHDDQVDNISMLSEFNAWRPSEVSVERDENGKTFSKYWDDEPEVEEGGSSYFV